MTAVKWYFNDVSDGGRGGGRGEERYRPNRGKLIYSTANQSCGMRPRALRKQRRVAQPVEC